MMPLSTSPVPAVASAGALEVVDGGGPVGPRDDRVVALEHDDRLRAPRRLARAAQPAAADLLARRAEQPRELAGVGREHGRRGARGERLEPARVGVEAVGVEQQRDLGAGRQRAQERERPVAAARARAEHERPGARDRRERVIDGRRAPALRRRRRPWPRVMTSSSRVSKIGSSDAGTSAVT